jgi:methylmalonyl-CoA mutase
VPAEVIRSTDAEKQAAIDSLAAFHARNVGRAAPSLEVLRDVAVRHGNTFAALMEAAKHCSLGQISAALYGVGGQYRRNM